MERTLELVGGWEQALGDKERKRRFNFVFDYANLFLCECSWRRKEKLWECVFVVSG